MRDLCAASLLDFARRSETTGRIRAAGKQEIPCAVALHKAGLPSSTHHDVRRAWSVAAGDGHWRFSAVLGAGYAIRLSRDNSVTRGEVVRRRTGMTMG